MYPKNGIFCINDFSCASNQAYLCEKSKFLSKPFKNRKRDWNALEVKNFEYDFPISSIKIYFR